MKLGFIGLGKMGQQMVGRLLDAGHEVVATDVNIGAIQQAKERGAQTVAGRDDLVHELGTEPSVVWVMIPAQFVETEINELLRILPGGSVVVDGGNSDFRQTIQRAETAAKQGVHLVDVGTSGGVHGFKDGFSMMVGGDKRAVAKVQPAIEALAQENGWAHFGPAGSGHFIKMVHNGIEYGVMEAYAEGYRILKEGHDFGALNLASIADVWQHGSIIASNLNGMAGEILETNAELEGIEGVVAESGEARWTVEVAQEKGLDAPVIADSLQVRHDSQKGNTHFGTKLLAALRNAFGGHDINVK